MITGNWALGFECCLLYLLAHGSSGKRQCTETKYDLRKAMTRSEPPRDLHASFFRAKHSGALPRLRRTVVSHRHRLHHVIARSVVAIGPLRLPGTRFLLLRLRRTFGHTLRMASAVSGKLIFRNVSRIPPDIHSSFGYTLGSRNQHLLFESLLGSLLGLRFAFRWHNVSRHKPNESLR